MGIENRLRGFPGISGNFRKFPEIFENPQGVFCLIKMTALSHFRKFPKIVYTVIFFNPKYSILAFRNSRKSERYFRPTRMMLYSPNQGKRTSQIHQISTTLISRTFSIRTNSMKRDEIIQNKVIS